MVHNTQFIIMMKHHTNIIIPRKHFPKLINDKCFTHIVVGVVVDNCICRIKHVNVINNKEQTITFFRISIEIATGISKVNWKLTFGWKIEFSISVLENYSLNTIDETVLCVHGLDTHTHMVNFIVWVNLNESVICPFSIYT